MLQKWRFDDWRVALESEQPQASVLRFVIYLAIQFPPKFSSLCSPCFQSVSREITIHIDLLCLQFLQQLQFKMFCLILQWLGPKIFLLPPTWFHHRTQPMNQTHWRENMKMMMTMILCKKYSVVSMHFKIVVGSESIYRTRTFLISSFILENLNVAAVFFTLV